MESIKYYVGFFFNFYLFLFLAVLCLCFWMGSSPAAASRGYSPGAVRRLLTAEPSPVVRHGRPGAWAPDLRLPSSTAQAQQWWCAGLLLCVVWDLPGPGIKPVSLPCIGRQILYHWATWKDLKWFLDKRDFITIMNKNISTLWEKTDKITDVKLKKQKNR